MSISVWRLLDCYTDIIKFHDFTSSGFERRCSYMRGSFGLGIHPSLILIRGGGGSTPSPNPKPPSQQYQRPKHPKHQLQNSLNPKPRHPETPNYSKALRPSKRNPPPHMGFHGASTMQGFKNRNPFCVTNDAHRRLRIPDPLRYVLNFEP